VRIVHTLRAVSIALLVLAEVGLWQWRMVIAARGLRGRAMTLGAVGAVLQVTALSQVVTDVHDALSIGAYAVGVGLGVLVGLVVGDRLTPGRLGVTVITTTPGVATGLWARGWPVTVQDGRGEDGPVTVLYVAIERRDESRLHADVATLAPRALWGVEELRRRPELRAAAELAAA
jgi:uncharacterized protein YebE (UPF0316 family)